MDDSREISWVLNNITHFYAPRVLRASAPPAARAPTWMRKISDRISAGQATPSDIEDPRKRRLPDRRQDHLRLRRSLLLARRGHHRQVPRRTGSRDLRQRPLQIPRTRGTGKIPRHLRNTMIGGPEIIALLLFLFPAVLLPWVAIAAVVKIRGKASWTMLAGVALHGRRLPPADRLRDPRRPRSPRPRPRPSSSPPASSSSSAGRFSSSRKPGSARNAPKNWRKSPGISRNAQGREPQR